MCKQKASGGMGFRNLQAFNKAMLAKQLWRILQNPNSLVARVLKSRYFPTGDILNAKIGNSPSYSWRSIHSSLDIIRAGTRWRVGNGKLIHIWEDKWLPTPSTYKVISPPSVLPQFPMVSSLINPMTKWWNVDLIKATFLPFEAEIILKIPLSRTLPEDKIIWIGNRHGDFTVKSAYHIAYSLIEESDRGESSSGDPCKPLWNRLWRLNLPAKIKVFAWRACINGLPTMDVISRRGISQSIACHVCGNGAESIDHALLHCDFSSLVWELWLENPLHTQGFKNSFLDSALFILSHSTLHDLEIFFATAWALWSNRNRIVHKDNGLSPLQVWHMARNVVEDFACSANWDFDFVRPAASNWVLPPPGTFKVNVDGASSEHDGSSSVGVVIRDSNGLVVAALCLPLQSHFSAMLTEIFALEQGVLLAQELQLPRVIVESDALAVIQAINDKATGSSFGHLIQEVLQVGESFESCHFKHLSRNHNAVAHELAQHARRTGKCQIWKGVAPPFVQTLLQSDLCI